MQVHTTGLLGALLYALRTAEELSKWVVLVCPPGDREKECRHHLAGVVPDNVKFSGRTAMVPGGGRVSVVSSAVEPFVPENEPFSVLFLGWDGSTRDPDGMRRWRLRAKEVLSLAP